MVLYELLAGVRPFPPKGTEAEIERAILGEDPEPPSRARRRAQTATGRAVGQPPSRRLASRSCRGTSTPSVSRRCGRTRQNRYASAAEFAEDIERYLAGAPVAARGGGPDYRLSRFYRRHRPAIAAAAVLGLLVTALGYSEVARRRVAPAAGAAEPTPRKFPFSGVAASDVPELERRFAAEPGSVETGANLVIALAKGDRRAEAELIVARLRQIPGRADDPLIDYAEATLAGSGAEPQRALVLFSTALERALSSGRGDLVSQTRASRGRLLSTLGRSEEARADMEAARTGFETSGDTASLARVLNDLSIEELQRGNLLAGERLLEQALAASRAAGPGGGGVILGNLAGIAMQRGRPDLAEPRRREAVQIFREAKSRRLSWALTDLSETLRELGRVAEADAALAEALTLLTAGPAGSDYAIALFYRGGAELDPGRSIESARRWPNWQAWRERRESARHSPMPRGCAVSRRPPEANAPRRARGSPRRVACCSPTARPIGPPKQICSSPRSSSTSTSSRQQPNSPSGHGTQVARRAPRAPPPFSRRRFSPESTRAPADSPQRAAASTA